MHNEPKNNQELNDVSGDPLDSSEVAQPLVDKKPLQEKPGVFGWVTSGITTVWNRLTGKKVEIVETEEESLDPEVDEDEDLDDEAPEFDPDRPERSQQEQDLGQLKARRNEVLRFLQKSNDFTTRVKGQQGKLSKDDEKTRLELRMWAERYPDIIAAQLAEYQEKYGVNEEKAQNIIGRLNELSDKLKKIQKEIESELLREGGNERININTFDEKKSTLKGFLELLSQDDGVSTAMQQEELSLGDIQELVAEAERIFADDPDNVLKRFMPLIKEQIEDARAKLDVAPSIAPVDQSAMVIPPIVVADSNINLNPEKNMKAFLDKLVGKNDEEKKKLLQPKLDALSVDGGVAKAMADETNPTSVEEISHFLTYAEIYCDDQKEKQTKVKGQLEKYQKDSMTSIFRQKDVNLNPEQQTDGLQKPVETRVDFDSDEQSDRSEWKPRDRGERRDPGRTAKASPWDKIFNMPFDTLAEVAERDKKASELLRNTWNSAKRQEKQAALKKILEEGRTAAGTLNLHCVFGKGVEKALRQEKKDDALINSYTALSKTLVSEQDIVLNLVHRLDAYFFDATNNDFSQNIRDLFTRISREQDVRFPVPETFKAVQLLISSGRLVFSEQQKELFKKLFSGRPVAQHAIDAMSGNPPTYDTAPVGTTGGTTKGVIPRPSHDPMKQPSQSLILAWKEALQEKDKQKRDQMVGDLLIAAWESGKAKAVESALIEGLTSAGNQYVNVIFNKKISEYLKEKTNDTGLVNLYGELSRRLATQEDWVATQKRELLTRFQAMKSDYDSVIRRLCAELQEKDATFDPEHVLLAMSELIARGNEDPADPQALVLTQQQKNLFIKGLKGGRYESQARDVIEGKRPVFDTAPGPNTPTTKDAAAKERRLVGVGYADEEGKKLLDECPLLAHGEPNKDGTTTYKLISDPKQTVTWGRSILAYEPGEDGLNLAFQAAIATFPPGTFFVVDREPPAAIDQGSVDNLLAKGILKTDIIIEKGMFNGKKVERMTYADWEMRERQEVKVTKKQSTQTAPQPESTKAAPDPSAPQPESTEVTFRPGMRGGNG